MFKKITLPNGVRIVCERIPHVRSISIGIWVGTGSRNEDTLNNGVSHFIEHMLFKGTEKRSAKQIAESIDNIGGQINAFTGKELTCYYTKTLDEHFDIALDVLADMFFHSRFEAKDIDVERKVILEEINMYEDSPEELVHDLLSETVWDGNSLGFPILGTEKCLNGFNKDTFTSYMKSNYRTDNCVVSVVGNFDEARLIESIAMHFGGWQSCVAPSVKLEVPCFVSRVETKEKDTEQVHLCIGFNGIEHGNEHLYSLLAVNNLFGGGMSSRLFQKIREERGLVYSIYSYPSSYRDTGLFTIYAGMNPEQLSQVIEMIYEEIRILKKDGISEDDLKKSKDQLKGGFILGLESTSSRMNSIGKSELMLGHINTPEEVLQKIDAITMETVHQVIGNVFESKRMSLCAVGNLLGKNELGKHTL